jgi:hypothetical protein
MPGIKPGMTRLSENADFIGRISGQALRIGPVIGS